MAGSYGIYICLIVQGGRKGEDYRQTETFQGSGCIHYLDTGNGFTGIKICQVTKPYTLNMYSLLYVNYTSIKL